jgi:hypothetical protein
MKIAVCISGQPRTWFTAKDNILSYFNLKGHEVDFFIHTWDKNTLRESSNTTWERTYVDVDKDEFIEIEKHFKPKLIEVEEYKNENFLSIWSSLFYSFMKSVWLKRKYELENDFEYDIVVKTRFDVNFHMEGYNQLNKPLNKFYLHPVVPLVGYTANTSIPKFDTEFYSNMFDDVFFYADSKTMDIISNIYFWFKDIVKQSHSEILKEEFITNREYFMGPGTLLYTYLTKWLIHPHGLVYIPYYIVRKESEDRNLHSINDWEKIKEISFNWYKKINENEK